MNRMEAAAERLLDRLLESSGETVSYNGTAMTVVIARTDHDESSRYGAEIVGLVQDFLIPSSALASDPVPNDRIVRADGTEFAVSVTRERDDFDDNCWRWSDSYRTVRRVHTKQVTP